MTPPTAHAAAVHDRHHARRWITLSILLTSVFIAGLDSSVLNVAIPTILREFRTNLIDIQWVVTGYTLVFASFLIIGGRLADLFGARRMFVVGAALFGIGSALASVSGGVGSLLIGESVIEGLGAALMLPASMGIINSTFVAHERATAFAAWGTTIGVAVAVGPLIGGYLTSYHSWRWAFRLNVIVVPLAILGAMLFMDRIPPASQRERVDLPGAGLIASSMFLLVFAISQSTELGLWTPTRPLVVGGHQLWSTDAPVAAPPVALLLAALLLAGFLRVERRKEATNTGPLLRPSTFRSVTFRYGLLTLLLLAVGQVAFTFVLAWTLQFGGRLTPFDTGLWLMPSGVAIIVGSQIGSRLSRRIGVVLVVRWGMVGLASGLALAAVGLHPEMSFLRLAPAILAFGIGLGFSGSQINNVILTGVPSELSGAASGTNTTVRMLGSAIGISTASALLNASLSAHANPSAVDTITAARPPLLVAAAVLTVAGVVSTRIPRSTAPGH